MNERIRKMKNRLQGEFILCWIIVVLFVALSEIGFLPRGGFVGNAQMEYILPTLGILLTCAMLPVSLRSYNRALARMRQLALEDALVSYCRWNEIRLAMLFVPCILNLSIYYMTGSTTGVFCACMVLTGTLFCLPTRSRILNELDLSKENEA